jgi:signal transduction histidine kinase
MALNTLWGYISNTGTRFAQCERERKEIIDLNRGLFAFLIIQLLSLVSHIINGLERSILMTSVFIVGLILIRFLIWQGKVNTAKISSIILINYNTVTMAIFLGPQTHVIDFLLLTALLPLYFFEIKNRKLIFWSVAVSIIPFALYHSILPYLSGYALPLNEQLEVYKTTEPVKILCLLALLILIYYKNSRYEKDVQEKEIQLTGQKRLYERLLEQIPIDIVTFDKDLRYSYINSAAIADPAVRKWLIGKTNSDYFKERGLSLEAAHERDRILHEALQKETTIQLEETLIDRNGRQRHTLKGASPIYSEQRELLCLVGYSLDITEIKEADRQLKEYANELEKKNDDLKHFVHATSHDLRSPLRNITSYLQLLEKRNAGKLDTDSLSMISHAVKSVKHLNQLIHDIYQYSVADHNENPNEITDLNTVMQDTMKMLGNVIFEKRATVRYTHLPVIKASQAHMAMLLSNLINNALKYNTAQNPLVKIDCVENNNEYIISVQDNGIGIAERHIKQIFEIFKRLNSSLDYEGTGVGLAICTKIVANYGGKIWVESEPDNGSTFYFSLAKKLVESKSIGAYKAQDFEKIAKAS